MTTATAAITTIPLTMSSREIAELTGKQHAHVMRDIRAMLEQIGEGQSKFGSTYLDAQGKARDCYNLPKNLTINLIAGYRADMRLKIIDRWMELEAQEHKPLVPQTYAEALLEAGRIAKERDALKVENRELAPKAEALDKLASLDGLHNIRSAAQQCGWPERKFAAKLCELKWCYRHQVTGRLTIYRETINRGLMDAKNVEVKRTGYVEGVGQPMLTQKGLAKIKTIIGVCEEAMRPFAKKSEPATT